MPVSAIDLFCGVGGLTHGLVLSGINVVAGIDIESSCRYAFEKNNNARFINADITTITGNYISELFPENHIRVLVGCAPCQPFSNYSSRYRKEGHLDEKWRLLYSFGNIIHETLPEIISMENVPQLSTQAVFFDFINTLQALGYHVSWSIINCPDYGVPQKRRRLVLLASQLGEINLIPPLYNKENYITVHDAIGNLPHIMDGDTDPNDAMHTSSHLSAINLQRIMSSTPNGTWRDWDTSLQLPCHKKKSGKSYPSVYGRMSWYEPSPTITTQFYGYGNGRFGHPEQNRALSLREGAILQSFPPNYVFINPNERVNKRQLGTQIGNAVPVELGRAIGLSILAHCEEVNDHG